MLYVQLKQLGISRIILGSNPISGFSHLGREKDLQMRRYYTTARIKDLFFQAESLGVNTVIGRADAFFSRVMLEYWDEGGKLKWIAQTCPEFGDPMNSVVRASANGASACYIHGGVMDNYLAGNRLETIKPAIDAIRKAGMAVGVAGHLPEVHEWANVHLDLDFHMCSYYNPIPRVHSAEHISGTEEQYLPEDRRKMVNMIPSIKKPVIHYKIFAAGRNDPHEAIEYAAANMRQGDMVCIGVFPQDKANMLEEDIHLFEMTSVYMQTA